MTGPRSNTGYVDLLPGDEIPRSVSPEVELGATGLRRTGGYVEDEFLPQLRGRRAVKVYREMADNSAVVAAWLTTLRWLLRQIEWRVEPASSSPDDRANAEFVEQNMHDMEHSWGDLIMEALSMVVYGWSNHELVFKRRQGLWPTNPANRSKYDDNKIGLRKIPIRGQETLLRWVFADNGDAVAMVQMAPPFYRTVVLPLNKCVLFRPLANKDNPEGYSLLRPMWRSWFMIKRLEEIEVVGAERDLTGLPVGRIPADYFTAAPGTDKHKMFQAWKKMVTGVRRNEQEGLLVPQKFDSETKQPEFDFALMSSGGSRQFNLDEVIQRYETRMLMSAMADFIMTGHEDTGASYALHTDKSGIFRTGTNALAQAIADPFNRVVIPKLFKLNGIQPKELPKLVPNDVDPPDLTQLAGFMTALANAGVQWFPDPELEGFLRDAARLPKLDKDVEAVREVEQRQAAVISLAQQKLQEIQIQQQAEQGEQQMQAAQLSTAQAAMGVSQQAQQMQQPPPDPNAAPADPGDPDGKQAAAQAQASTDQAGVATQRARVGLDTDKAKLAQERERLQQLRRARSQGTRGGPSRNQRDRPSPRGPVRKRNPFLEEV